MNSILSYLASLSLELVLLILRFKPRKDKIFNSLNSINKNSKLLFVPHGSLDCLLLHRFFLNSISKQVSSTKLLINNQSIDFNLYIKKAALQNKLDNYTHSIFQIKLKNLCKKYNLLDFYSPLLDSIERILDYTNFFEELTIDEALFLEVHQLIRKFQILSEQFDVLFLADSAYLTNAIIKKSFIRKNRAVYYLNPAGHLLKFCGENCIEFSYCDNNSHVRSKSNEIIFSQDKLRVKKRSNLESKIERRVRANKKVLYAHVLRDAKLLRSDSNQIFCNSIDWFEFMLGEITKNNDWDNWFLKIHPDSNFYENENKLFDYYISKYKVPEEVYKNCPDKEQILSSGMVIYTFSGTIVAESMVRGHKVIFCSDRFPAFFGIYCKSQQELRKYISMGTEAIHNNVFLYETVIQENAQLFLSFWYGLEYKNLTRFVPKRPCLPGDSTAKTIGLMIHQFMKILLSGSQDLDPINV